VEGGDGGEGLAFFGVVLEKRNFKPWKKKITNQGEGNQGSKYRETKKV